MEQSILKSVKNIANVVDDDFDEAIILHVNAAFGVLYQLGIGDQGMFTIEDETAEWDDYGVPADQLALAKQYIQLSVKAEFDPSPTSFGQDATKDKLKNLEWRLNVMKETSA